MATKIRNTDPAVGRRGFLAGAGGLTVAIAIGGATGLVHAQSGAPNAALNAWVTIGPDDVVTVMAPSAEMGQGILTTLALVIAEELDADWSKVRTAWAPPNHAVYGNPRAGGFMVTVASVAVAGYFTPLRQAGAQARRILIDAVAEEWKVARGELTTEPGKVVHAASNRRIAYGDIVKFAKVPAEPPKIEEAELKPANAFRLIGRDMPRIDVPSKVDGSARYGIDARVPGMAYAAVSLAPLVGAKPARMDQAAAQGVAGVTRVLTMPFGVAVIAETIEAAFAGRERLKVAWNTDGLPGAAFDSAAAPRLYAATAREPGSKPLVAWFEKGDAPKAMSEAARRMTAEYVTEHTYHAQMEPMNCTARVAEDGKSAEVWVGTQSPTPLVVAAARALGTEPRNIRIHQHYLGGGFGRRHLPDAVVQAVLVAKEAGRPVKLVWTREDDLVHAQMRPFTYHRFEAGLDARNDVVAWHHRLVAESVDALVTPARLEASKGKDLILQRGQEQPFYAIPNMLADWVRENHGTRLCPWRGIGAGYNKFASECFLDEIAHAKGIDPLDYRIALTEGQPRAQGVIRAVAELADWRRKREGRGLGIAFTDYHGTFSAGIAEVSVDRASGQIRVHNYWLAIDAGLPVQPHNIEAQLESAAIFGIGAALKEQATLKAGVVQETNYHDYTPIRMSEVPDIRVRVLATANAPTGIGEVGLPPTAPSIGNAVFALTGKRLRHLPMTPERVLAALKA